MGKDRSVQLVQPVDLIEQPSQDDVKAWRGGPRYSVVRRLGSGSYGTVFEAEDTRNSRLVAVKCVPLVNDPVHLRGTLREVSILNMLRGNHNMMQLLDLFLPCSEKGGTSEILMVLEKCQLDLRKFICAGSLLSPHQAERLMYTITRGIAYLHSGGIWHRDLKPENCLLLPQSCDVKIADFGMSRAVGWCDFNLAGLDSVFDAEDFMLNPPKEPEHLTVWVCTRWYRAPELLLGQPDYTEAVDVWSMGCIFAEVMQSLDGFPTSHRRGPLFRGEPCDPRGSAALQTARKDMFELIFDLLGTPLKDQMKLLREEDRRRVSTYRQRPGCGIEAMMPLDNGWLDLLKVTLSFWPRERSTARDLQGNPLFHRVREVGMEKPAPSMFRLKFEEEPDEVKRLLPYLVREMRRFV